VPEDVLEETIPEKVDAKRGHCTYQTSTQTLVETQDTLLEQDFLDAF
jgi:hypothetical protein